jgi:mycofactocin system glycosyltransferase
MNYRLSQHVELVENNGEHLLVSRSPLSVLKLNRSLHELVSRASGGLITPSSRAEEQVLEQLAGKGFVERDHSGSPKNQVSRTVSIVIPVKDRAGELARCLGSIASVNYPKELLQVIVVDDGSTDQSAAVARKWGALVVESGGTGRGPAAARNVGARSATGEILAFIDSDCTASQGWLSELIPAFCDARIAAVGGQVDGMCTESSVDLYEAVMSSLSLGNRERSGNSGDDTFYLPSCNLLLRRSLFAAVGGFEDSMHVGEDVDLTWRLRNQGWTIAYLPAGRIYHEHRSTIRSFMSRRFDYGTSEGILQRLHPNRHKRMVIPPLLALLLALCLMAPFTGWLSLGVACGVMAVDALVFRLRLKRRRLPIGIGALLGGRLRALGSLAYYLSYHLVRYYSIPLVLVSLFVPLFWLVTLGVVGCAAGVDYSVKKPNMSFISFAGVYVLEQLAYGAGVFWGCLRRKTFASYRVEILPTAQPV